MEEKEPIKIKLSTALLFIGVCLVIVIGVCVGIWLSNKEDKKIGNNKTNNTSIGTQKNLKSDQLTETQKQILGVEESKEKENVAKKVENDEKTYSDLYKKYLELSEEKKKETKVIPRKKEVKIRNLDEIEKIIDKKFDEYTKKQKNESNQTQINPNISNTYDNNVQKDEVEIDQNGLPKKFNLADKIDISVTDQGDYGLCWGFASLKALETHLALNGKGNYNLSEMHLDYIESSLMYGDRELHDGGNFEIFKDYISESGVVTEDEVPYREYEEEEYRKFNKIKKVTEVTETIEFPEIWKGNEDLSELWRKCIFINRFI